MTYSRSRLKWLAPAALLALSPLSQAETADLLVLYTDSALAHPNGRDIQSRIQASVAWANQALRNSQTDFQLRLVHTAKADASYNGLLTSNDLGRLRADANVAALRRRYGADFVTLIGPSREWCGIGYVSSGDARTGRLYNSAADWAYNLVSISCGFATFAHELGHNFGLGHSNIQNSRGGVWNWARGHGETGVFTTIMGYTSAFRTNNRVQYFSNPRLNACEGRACGIPVGQPGEADSSLNINRLDTQLAAFLPTVVDGGGNGGGTGGGGQGGGTLCNSTLPENNLIQGGDFNTLDPWTSAFNLSTLDTYQESTGTCVDNRLRIAQRSAWYSGAAQDLTDALRAGGTFRLALKARLGDASARERVYATLRLRDSAGYRYQYLAAGTLEGDGWLKLTAEFEPDWRGTPDQAELLIYGPSAGRDLLVDKASLVKLQAPTPEHVFSSSLETGLEGWKSGWGARLSRARDSYDGRYSLKVTNRDQWVDAAWQDLTGLVQANTGYALNLHVKHSASAGSQPYTLYLLYRDGSGWHWQRLLRRAVNGGTWQALSASLRVNSASLSNARLYIMGPAAGVNFKLDQVVIDQP